MSCDTNPPDRKILILKPVNQEGNDNNVIIDATLDSRPSTSMNVTLCPPTHPRKEDVPLPPSRTEDIPIPPTKRKSRFQRHETLVEVDDVASILENCHKGGGKPPYDSDRGSNSRFPHHPHRRKTFGPPQRERLSPVSKPSKKGRLLSRVPLQEPSQRTFHQEDNRISYPSRFCKTTQVRDIRHHHRSGRTCIPHRYHKLH